MAPKGRQPLLIQIYKKRFLGSQVHFEIFESEVRKNQFLHILWHSIMADAQEVQTFTKSMNYCFLHFRHHRFMLKLQNFGIWQGLLVKLGSNLGSSIHNFLDLYWKLFSIDWLLHHLLWLFYSGLIKFFPMFLLIFILSAFSCLNSAQ